MKSKIALALIVKGDDAEAVLLDDLLENSAKHVDGVFVTVTQPNKAVEDVVAKYKGTLSHFEWCNDFAKARNFNFSQVPKEYTHILWADADDNFRNLKNLRKALEENPKVDVFSMNYLYHFNEYKQPDVVHMKTMVVKNDGCVEWVGKIHEDFKENRTITRFFIEGIERIHMTTDERIGESKKRNLVIAKATAEEMPDDPRVYWNLAHAHMGLGNYQEAKEAFVKFAATSKSDEEKYLAYIDMSKIADIQGNKEEAIEKGRMAIGIRPEYPDAYHSLGQIYYNQMKYREAETNILLGLTKKPPYYSIIVHNPRDYDFTPLMLLAKTYFQLSRPDQAVTCLKGCIKIQPRNAQALEMLSMMEKESEQFQIVAEILSKAKDATTKEEIQALLDSAPDEVKSHPGLCNLRNVHFPKTESSGKDIVYFCGFTQEEWTPETARVKGIGGSEEAVIWLTREFARRGYNVTVYNNCGHKAQVFDGVTYKPFWEWNYRDKQDVTIVWRNPQILGYGINSTKVFLDMHDVIPEGEMTAERIAKADKVFFKSKYQRDLYKDIPEDKCIIVPNGIDSSIFDVETERDTNLIINTSAPNRGIFALTHMFREIKKRHPAARLQWAYGWETFTNGFRDDPAVMAWKDKLMADMEEIGVEYLGRVSHSEVAKLYLKAGIWAYPSGFGEIDCISLSKAMAAGAFPVTTDFAALGEKQGHGGHFIHSDITTNNWLKPNNHDFSIVDEQQISDSIDAIVNYLQNPPTEEERMGMRKWAQEKFAWDNIYPTWIAQF